MIEFSPASIADLTQGQLVGEIATDLRLDPALIRMDSRECVPGSIYVAKPGEHADGHDFMAQAFASGAVLALAEREIKDAEGQLFPAVIVPDAVLAMGQLATGVLQQARAQGQLSVIGITGSAGKTTTKDLLAGILSTHAPTVAPQGSYNGEIGVPLTVFQVTAETRYLIVEMGATGRGHIEYLAKMVKPDVGVVLMVGSAHAGEFGGVENIARAKGEIVEGLSESGVAILNAADSQVCAMTTRTKAKILWFGEVGTEPTAADTAQGVWASAVTTTPGAHPSLTLEFPDGSSEHVISGLTGIHHLGNILAAAAAAHSVGIAPADIAAALQNRGPASRWRMERTDRPDGVTVINDAYNANPESMRAALRALAELGRSDVSNGSDGQNGSDGHGLRQGGLAHRRTWAVLGPMLELGEDSIREHNALGQNVVRLNISRLVVIGREARPLHIGAINEGSWGEESVFFDTVEEAEAYLQEQLEPGDLVLFKSSRNAGVRYLGDRIAWGTTNSPTPPTTSTAPDARTSERTERS